MIKLIAIIILFIPPVCFSQAVLSTEQQTGFESISSEEIFSNISFLASDSLKGRATGSDENLIAGMFIARKFYDYGLEPINSTASKYPHKEELLNESLDIKNSNIYNGYFQKFNLKKSSLSNRNYLSINEKRNETEKTINYDFGIDFLLQYNSAKNIKVTATLVFVGYGIVDEANGYNDYKNSDGFIIDVRNKIVVIVDGYPQENDTTSIFNKKRKAAYINPRTKSEAALERGALAVILISSPIKTDPPISIKYEKLTNSFEREFFHLPELERESLPVIYASKSFTSELFNNTGIKLLEKIKHIDSTLTPASFTIENKSVSFEINFDQSLVPTQNVLGFIEGSDPELKEEVVVIGAHYDHIGLGNYGAMDSSQKGEIHNGADDNASGTCGLIELAEAFSKAKPKRSVLFIAFSAEENGILGSRYYAYVQPVKPLDKTVAMLNLDMIGRNEPELLWIGGAFYGDDIKSIVEEANENIGFELLYNVGLLNFASDQGPFLKKEIPSIFFFAGLHDDYHTPGDDIEKLDIKKIEKVSKLAYLTGRIIGDTKIYPKYRALSMDEKTALVKESLERQRKIRIETEKTTIN